jgi:outer membrane cobalamin receptor
MKLIFTFLLLLFSSYCIAQYTISGQVTDAKGIAIIGANVYLEGTYDGGSTDEFGNFSFITTEKGEKNLVVSYLSYETFTRMAPVAQMTALNIRLREEVNTLSGVTLTAGTFKAGDNSKASVLKPLDVVTTASALGDFVGALQTLPGTSTVAEDGRLFVRGGNAGETQVFIDGIRVFTPFTPTTNNIPTRGRYSPFLFDGITFSTGGYSAEFGQALSSVLLLNTINEPDQEKTDIGLMTVGGSLGNTQKWDNSSLSINATYINLAPYLEIFPDRNDWIKPFQSASGEAVYRQKFKNGLLKLYTAFDHTGFELDQEDINFENLVRFKLNNNNLYFNGSYKGVLKNDWIINTGASYTYGNTNLNIIEDMVKQQEHSVHLKTSFKRAITSRFKLHFGGEYFTTTFQEDFTRSPDENFANSLNNNILGTFIETDYYFSKKLAFKAGVRWEYAELLREANISPRVSIAWKSGEYSQFSWAYGDFYQNPQNDILKFDRNLEAEQASHYIMNYQYNRNGRVFRAEAYYKDYKNLVKFNSELPLPQSLFSNSGDGYAQGIDLFWRDNSSIKNMDYWVSYSYLDTQRNFRNFPEQAAPSFTSKHNISVVGKYWVDKWKSQVGIAYNFASGRPYNNPNTTFFLAERTKAFHNLSLNWAYLLSPQKILYFSVNNVLGTRNINGYQYAQNADVNGNFRRRALRPAADSFFFIGFFWTISEDKKSNQLDNL